MTNEKVQSAISEGNIRLQQANNSEQSILPARVPPPLESTPIKTWVDEFGKTRVIADPKLTRNGCQKYVTGTKDTEIAENILYTGLIALESIIEVGKSSAEKVAACLNIMAQSLNDFQPKDAFEARLISQAVALYQHGMDRLGKAGRTEQTLHSEAQLNMGIKLLRVHNETIETLNRYRRGCEQKIIVTHSVIAAQTVVNNFQNEGGAENKGDIPCS